jgi:hypothetical protein
VWPAVTVKFPFQMGYVLVMEPLPAMAAIQPSWPPLPLASIVPVSIHCFPWSRYTRGVRVTVGLAPDPDV